MKKWLKSGICGTHEQCTVYCLQLTWSNSAAGTKKKKKKKNENAVSACAWVPISAKRKPKLKTLD